MENGNNKFHELSAHNRLYLKREKEKVAVRNRHRNQMYFVHHVRDHDFSAH